jgi:hypothetical protein
MLFNSPAYGAFLLATFALFWLVHRHRLARVLLLTIASYGFYFFGTLEASREQPVPLGPMAWSALCLGIIFAGSTIDFWVGRKLGKTVSPRARKALLLVSIVYYLGVLSVFKYWNFAFDALAQLAHAVGLPLSPLHLRLVLPFGISFFTFETMSYTIDVYRRELEPAERYLDYLLFVCFFPHLVAGPIVRPRDMLPQLRDVPVYDARKQAEGLWLIATGLVKKVVVGDTLAVSHVNRVFENPERFSSLEVVVGVYAYAVQIYADFSGYTDVALGSAKLFGYELPQNFNAPYVAKNLQEFWHRWHISLSGWLRDYLYIPLGGSRGSNVATYRNLLITMVLGGLWHGASWNFVIWGALHGVALAGTRMWQRWRGPRRESWIGAWGSTFVTFQYVCFAWIFFRAPTFGHAVVVLERIATGGFGVSNLAPRVLLLLACAMGVHFLPRRATMAIRDRFAVSPAFVQGALLAAVALALHLAAGAKAEPFVYGQF